jgi:uncharacterized membrane protein YidH (DUF202 family)
MKRFRWQLRALVVLAAFGFLGIAFHRAIASLTTADRRIMPEVTQLGDYFAIAALATTLYLVYLLVRYARAEIRDRSGAYKAAYWIGSLLAHAVLAVGVAILILVANPEFPFEPRLIAKQASPDGDHVAYLYQAGLLCGYEVYVRDAGDAELRKRDSIPRNECDDSLRLRWSDDSKTITVVDAAGEPVTPQYWNLHLDMH